MAESFKRTEIVEDERGSDQSLERGVKAVLTRMNRVDATVEDLGFDEKSKVRLREGDDRDAMISALRGKAAGMAKFAIAEAPVTENAEVVVTEQPVAAGSEKKPELTPEEAEATLGALEAQFKANMYLHEGVEWPKVRSSLEADPRALLSINKMQAAGHEPDVYDADAEGFDIGTCSKESPASGRNCVYGPDNAKWLRENRPNEKFNGSAVEMAEAMGIKLMDPDKYKKVLQAKGKFDEETWSWLLASPSILSTGNALNGNRSDLEVYVFRNPAYSHGDNRAWRCSLRVKWAA